MAYYAQIDSSNIVLQVIVADSAFIASMSGTWIQTDISGVSPKNYAGKGHTWNSSLNGFIPPKPYASWTLNTSTCLWQAPIPMPIDGHIYRWDEPLLSWVLMS